MTRVVAGAHGGRRLRVPKGRATRPTSDRVREALFSTLGDRTVGATVLDLFAGSGALGIEALSRGAARATFVERDRHAARVLRENLSDLGLEARVHVTEVGRFLRDLEEVGADEPYDLVLCDPPYTLSSDEVSSHLLALARSRWVRPDAVMVAERARHGEELVFAESGLRVTDARTYGDTVLYYLQRGVGADEGRGHQR